MALGPVIFLGAIGLNGRAGAPPDDRPVFGLENHRRLLKYIVPVQEAMSLQHKSPLSDGKLESVIVLWEREFDSGELQSILPADFDTAVQDTVLGEINTAKSQILYHLFKRVERASSNGELEKEAELLAHGMRIASINKYSDFSSVHYFGSYQIRFMNSLAALSHRLNEETKQEVKVAIMSCEEHETKLKVILSKVRDLHCAVMSRKGTPALAIELSQNYGRLAAAFDEQPSNQIAQIKAVAMSNDITSEIVGVSTLARIALRTEGEYKQSLRNLKSKL